MYLFNLREYLKWFVVNLHLLILVFSQINSPVFWLHFVLVFLKTFFTHNGSNTQTLLQVRTQSGDEVLKYKERVLKGFKFNFKIPAYALSEPYSDDEC